MFNLLISVQVFLHQGSGDVGLSGDLTKAACKTCTDLDLPGVVLRGVATEEELFCFLWCYTLDRNHAYKVRTSRCLLDVNLPPTFADLYPTFPDISELLLIYIDLARIQDIVVSYLPDSLIQPISSLHATGEYMLLQMENISHRMNQVRLIPRTLLHNTFAHLVRLTHCHRSGKDLTGKPKCLPSSSHINQ